MEERIKLLIMDVDGTLTDGGIYIGNSGEVMKKFSAKDGYGIHVLCKEYQIIPVIMTGRDSRIVENRCKELEIEYIFQNCKDKKIALDKLCRDLNISHNQVAYIGDDLNDLEIMKCVGVCGCPADAVEKVKEVSDFVSSHNGGDGAVREFVEYLIGLIQ